MSDIVERLRQCDFPAWNEDGYCSRGEEAADEIERLRAALAGIAPFARTAHTAPPDEARAWGAVRAALGKTGGEK
jgi:hypothetical protein